MSPRPLKPATPPKPSRKEVTEARAEQKAKLQALRERLVADQRNLKSKLDSRQLRARQAHPGFNPP